MRIQEFVSRFPDRVPLRKVHPRRDWRLVGDAFAAEMPLPQAWAGQVLFTLGDDEVAVCRMVDGDEEIAGGHLVLGVYTLSDAGPMAVPSGRIYVRVEQGEAVTGCARLFDQLGFEIAYAPAYAPHTAWISHRSGDVATGLSHVEELCGVDRLVNVEAQMLSAVGRR